VDLTPWLDDVAARSQDDFLVVGAESDLSLEDDRVFILERVDVRRHEGAHRERVLDDRERAPRVLTVDLEDHADARGQIASPATSWLNHLDLGRDRGQSIATR
jgi:hypothetical protein